MSLLSFDEMFDRLFGTMPEQPARVMFGKGYSCRHCGCTDFQACVTDGIPCHWVEPGLCSACVEAEQQDSEGGTYGLPR